MTGLGILGTFLGLVLGISGFDTASTEAITSSISGLLSGMGTAFLTSIVGVIFFTLFFPICTRLFTIMQTKIWNCLSINFHEKELDGHDNSTENQLLGYQQQQTNFQLQQTELLKTFAGIVSEAVSKSISDTMKSELTPIFNRMEQTIEMFGKFASTQQKEGLDQVVQEFIRCMNDSLKRPIRRARSYYPISVRVAKKFGSSDAKNCGWHL